MSLIWGGEKEAKSIPHLTARFASRFNWLRLFLGSSSESLSSDSVVGSCSGTLALRRFPREKANEKRREINLVFADSGGEVRRRWWWCSATATLAQVRWWWKCNHGHCLRGRSTCWLIFVCMWQNRTTEMLMLSSSLLLTFVLVMQFIFLSLLTFQLLIVK